MKTPAQNGGVVGAWFRADHAFSQAVLDSLPANVVVLNREGVIVAINQAWQQFAEENQGRQTTGVGVNYLEVAQAASGPFSAEAQAAHRGIRAVLDGALSQFSLEYACHSPSKQRWFQMEVRLMRDSERPAAVVMHHEITARKLAEEALRASEHRFRALVENSSDGISLLSANGELLFSTPSGTRMTGFAVGENYGKRFTEFVHPDDLNAVQAEFKAVISGVPPPKAIAFRYRHKNGTWRWFEATAANLLADPAVRAIVVNYRDITERRLVDEALRSSERCLRLALEAGGMGTWVWDIEANQSNWNAQEYRLLGLEPAEGPVDTSAFWKLVHPEDLPELNRVLAEAVQQRTEFKCLFRIVRPDGTTRWLAGRGQVIPDEQTGEARQMFGVNFDVTESKETEVSLRHAESLLRLVLNASPNLVHVKDRDSRFLLANQALANLYGLPLTDIIGQRQTDVYRKLGRKLEALEPWLELDRQVMDTGKPIPMVEDTIDPHGILQKFHTKKLPIDLNDGKRAVLTVAADVTELHNLTNSLRTRLRQQQAVAELGLFAFKTDDFDALLHKCVETVGLVLDNECCKVLELQPDGESLYLRAGVGWHEGLVGHATVPSDRGSQAGYTLLSGEPVIVADLHSETRFNGPKLLLDHGIVSGMSVVIPGAGPPFWILGTHTRQRREFSRDDVSFLQSVANVLASFIERRRIETQYQQLVESVEDYAIITLDLKGGVTTWNSGAERMTGFKAADVIGQTTASFYPPEEVASGKPTRDLAEALQTGRIESEGWRLRRDGSRFLANCITIALRDTSGKPCGFSRVVRDITAQRTEEEALRSAVDHSVDAIFTIDEDGVIQSCGGAVQRLFGYSGSELVGRNVDLLVSEPQRTEHTGYIRNYLRTGVAKIIGKLREVVGVRKDGSAIPLEIVITEFSLDGCRFFTGILRDTSERKKLEEQLRQAHKMEAIGQLAGGVAHDFNNLLTVISGFSDMVANGLRPDDPNRMLLQEVQKAGERAASLTRQLLAFSRKQVLEPRVLDLNALITDTKKMLGRLIGEDVKLTTTLAPGLGRVKVDPGQMEQVIWNLAVNARDAMPNGGNLTIETSNVVLDEFYLRRHTDVAPGPYVLLAMSDTGCGMTPEVQAHIFEPFYTTKGPGKGTGLGLATVFGIVKQSGGYLDVYSEPGFGTTFKVYLPSVDQAVTTDKAHFGDKRPQPGTETILVVEDEDAVRTMTCFALRMFGYTVLEASHAIAAVELCEQHQGSLHLVVTDVVMPEMGGRQLVECLTRRRPDLKVLYLSGYTDDAVVRHGILQSDTAFLQKPFTPVILANKVREVLDR